MRATVRTKKASSAYFAPVSGRSSQRGTAGHRRRHRRREDDEARAVDLVPAPREEEALRAEQRGDGEEGLDRGRPVRGDRPAGPHLRDEAGELEPRGDEKDEVRGLDRGAERGQAPVRVLPTRRLGGGGVVSRGRHGAGTLAPAGLGAPAGA